MKYKLTITFEDGHIERAVCDYYLFKQLEAYAIDNQYGFAFDVVGE